MTGGEIFLICFIIFIGAMLFENSQTAKLAKEMADKGYEEVLENGYDSHGDIESKKIWKKVKD